MILIGGADQGEVTFIGNGENDAAIGILENIGAVVIIKPWQHDVATLDQPEARRLVAAHHRMLHRANPGAGGIDQGAGVKFGRPITTFTGDTPQCAIPPRGTYRHARVNGGTAFRRILGVQQHQARILYPAIGIFKADAMPGAERRAEWGACQINALGWRQRPSPAQMIIQKQPKPQQPGGSEALVMRQHKAQGPDDMRRDAKQDFAFNQRFTHQAKLVMFQIAQATMDQLGGIGRSAAGQIAFFEQHHGKPASRRIPRNAGAIDATTNDGQVVGFSRR